MTYFEQLKQMSVEQLAERIIDFERFLNDACKTCKYCKTFSQGMLWECVHIGNGDTDGTCINTMIEFLKSEVMQHEK